MDSPTVTFPTGIPTNTGPVNTVATDPNKIAVGDVVRVNDIPCPKMLVYEVIGSEEEDFELAGHVRVMWFNQRWEVQYATLDPRLLFKWPPRERGKPVDHEEHADAAD